MRLHERSSDYDYTLVDNVLADPSERAADRLP
jgi:hypothetical protein